MRSQSNTTAIPLDRGRQRDREKDRAAARRRLFYCSLPPATRAWYANLRFTTPFYCCVQQHYSSSSNTFVLYAAEEQTHRGNLAHGSGVDDIRSGRGRGAPLDGANTTDYACRCHNRCRQKTPSQISVDRHIVTCFLSASPSHLTYYTENTFSWQRKRREGVRAGVEGYRNPVNKIVRDDVRAAIWWCMWGGYRR